jgi:hypothetical protein
MPAGALGFAGGLVGGLVIALVAAAVIVAAWPSLRAQIAPPPRSYDATIDALDRRMATLEAAAGSAAGGKTALADLEKRLATLDQAIHAPPPEDPRILQLSAKLDQLTSQVAALQAPSQAEADMRDLVTKAEAAAQAAQSTASDRRSAEALLIVFGQLRDAVERGHSYAVELAAARKVAPDEAKGDLDALAATADSGVTPRDELIDAFPAVNAAIARAGLIGDAGDGFWGHLEHEAMTLVTVRRVDGRGKDPASVAARAEKDVRADDLDGALKELATLDGPPAAEAKDWVAKAKARLAAEHALSGLAAKAGAAVKPAASN